MFELLNEKNIDKLKVFSNNAFGKLIIAGPCAIEGYDEYYETAKFLYENGVEVIRGGAYKPRTSTYSFQGMGKEGVEIMEAVKKSIPIKIITEAVDCESLEQIYDVADIIQIGSRNMQNFSLLKEVGKQDKPVLLKRGMSATLNEWLCAAEYIAREGNGAIIMCERGIRSFSDFTRNTLDLSVVPAIKNMTDLMVVVDPSHGTGRRDLIEPMSMAGLACGADGIMIEVHKEPEKAMSDGDQSINFSECKNILNKLRNFNKK